MRDLKILTGLVYFCVAGVGVSLGGGIYTAIQQHREEAKPKPTYFPTPATVGGGRTSAAPAQQAAPPRSGELPVPAH